MNLREVDVKLFGYGFAIVAIFILVVAFSSIQEQNNTNTAEKQDKTWREK